jgi:hypothetical protein
MQKRYTRRKTWQERRGRKTQSLKRGLQPKQAIIGAPAPEMRGIKAKKAARLALLERDQ